MVCGKRGERPSTQRSPAIGSMITTGSVRGKCSALQTGQSRRQPPCVTIVAALQLGQKRWRACQPRIGLASASGGTCSAATAPCTAMVRRSRSFRSLRAFSTSIAAGSRPAPKRGAPCNKPRNTVSRGAPSSRASAGENSGSSGSSRCFQHHIIAADHIDAGPGVLAQRRELAIVAAEMCGAIEQAAGIGLARWGGFHLMPQYNSAMLVGAGTTKPSTLSPSK